MSGSLISRAYELALELVDKTALTSSQFRNYFGELRIIYNGFTERRVSWDETRLRLELLLARLAYGTRKKGGVPVELFEVLAEMLKDVVEADAEKGPALLESAMRQVEAILALFYPLRDLKDEVESHNRKRENRHNPRDFRKEAELLFGRLLK
jgi:CRISPR-associated protein Csm2